MNLLYIYISIHHLSIYHLLGTQWSGVQHLDFSFVAGTGTGTGTGTGKNKRGGKTTATGAEGAGAMELDDDDSNKSKSKSKSKSNESEGATITNSAKSTLDGLHAMFSDVNDGTSTTSRLLLHSNNSLSGHNTHNNNNNNNKKKKTLDRFVSLAAPASSDVAAGVAPVTASDAAAGSADDHRHSTATAGSESRSKANGERSAFSFGGGAAATASSNSCVGSSRGGEASPPVENERRSKASGEKSGVGGHHQKQQQQQQPPPVALSSLVSYDFSSFFHRSELTRLVAEAKRVAVKVAAAELVAVASSSSNVPTAAGAGAGTGAGGDGAGTENVVEPPPPSSSSSSSSSSSAAAAAPAPAPARFVRYGHGESQEQCRDIPPEISRVLACEVVAASTETFRGCEKGVPVAHALLQDVSWEKYLDHSSCVELGLSEEAMQAARRGAWRSRVDNHLARAASPAIAAAGSGNSIKMDKNKNDDDDATPPLSQLDSVARGWEQCLGASKNSQKASRTALVALREKIRATVKKLEAKSMRKAGYFGVKSLCKHAPLFVLELPDGVVDIVGGNGNGGGGVGYGSAGSHLKSIKMGSTTTSTSAAGSTSTTRTSTGGVQIGFFATALEAALVREQILDFAESARMQGPCSTNFSTREWSMLTGLGKQISAFLKVSARV
jgi:hypothetical protein